MNEEYPRRNVRILAFVLALFIVCIFISSLFWVGNVQNTTIALTSKKTDHVRNESFSVMPEVHPKKDKAFLKKTFVFQLKDNETLISREFVPPSSHKSLKIECSNAGVMHNSWNISIGTLETSLSPNPDCPSMLRATQVHVRKNRLKFSKMKRYSIGMLYYCEPNHLRHHLNIWRGWSHDLLNRIVFVIIDDGSPDECSALTLIDTHLNQLNLNNHVSEYKAFPFSYEVFSIDQDIPWNVGGGRNLLMTVVPTEYVLFIDADTYVDYSLALFLSNKVIHSYLKNINKYITFFGRTWFEKTNITLHPHPAVTFITKSLYWQIGGCDEDFVGNYGFTDPHFRFKAQRTSHAIKLFANKLNYPKIIMIPNDHKVIHVTENTKTFLIKNSSHNEQLFEQKVSGELPWSKSFLRFTWKKVIESHLI